VKADMAATVASQADNAVTEKARVATVRDREVTRDRNAHYPSGYRSGQSYNESSREL
jgi:hypothetical protein